MRTAIYLLIAALFYNTNCEEDHKLPSYMTACDLLDKSRPFEDCVKEQMQKSVAKFSEGVPDLGVPTLDPLTIDDVHINGNGLNLSIINAKMYGIKDSKITSLKNDLKTGDFDLEFRTDFKLKGQYTVDGKILILPIQGKGDATIWTKNTTVTITNKMKYDDKMEHFKLIQPSYKYKIDTTVFKFDNLFNGNKEVSEATHKFANENWEQIMNDLAPPAIQQIVKTCVKAINKFLSKVKLGVMMKNWEEHVRRKEEH